MPVFDVNELMDFLKGFSMTHSSRNDGGTAVVSFSGGGGIITADFLHDFNLPLAQLSQKTLQSIKEVFPPWMEPSNPVDIWPAVIESGMEKVYTKVIDAVMHDENVDSLIVHLFSERIDSSKLRPLSEMKDKLAKPAIVWAAGTWKSYHKFKKDLEEMGIPVFEEMGRGVSFLSAVKQHYLKKARV